MTENHNAISRLYRYLYIEARTFAPESAVESPDAPEVPAPPPESVEEPLSPQNTSDRTSTRSNRFTQLLTGVVAVVMFILIGNNIRIQIDQNSVTAPNPAVTKPSGTSQNNISKSDRASTNISAINTGDSVQPPDIKSVRYSSKAVTSSRSIPSRKTPASLDRKISSGTTLLDPYKKSDAKRIQLRLTDLGFYKSKIDGIWGKGSMTSLVAFTKSRGLHTTKIWDISVQHRLFSIPVSNISNAGCKFEGGGVASPNFTDTDVFSGVGRICVKEGDRYRWENLKHKKNENTSISTASEFRARHILVKTETEALQIIRDLNGGADFIMLAKEKSTAPSRGGGGDVGWFKLEYMVKPFSDAVVRLEKGRYSSAPVRTKFGWHVIKLEDTR